MFPLLAAHISDGVLRPLPMIVGIAVTLALLGVAVRRLSDEEMPRLVLCTAFFFVGSQIHLSVGPTSVHLLLNSLLGLLLGFKAIVPIGVGLLMQAVLFGHGGYLVWGTNCLIFMLPAILMPRLFKQFRASSSPGGPTSLPFSLAIGYVLAPLLVFPIWFFGECFRLIFDRKSLFTTAFLTGFIGVMLTITLNCLVLLVFGNADWKLIVYFVFVCHLPLAIIEGIVVGFVLEALASTGRSWPEMPIDLRA